MGPCRAFCSTSEARTTAPAIRTCAAHVFYLSRPGEAYLRFFGQYLEHFPICLDTAPPKKRLRLAELGEQMTSLYEQWRSARTGHEKTALKRQIETTGRHIDRLVYNLYGLTEEEIEIVETATQ